ncbi:MAG TPA: acyl-CoA dehydrogenase N-terminal domain-containing protein, partial [Hyphomonas sp.]|nr:acyl-CoA dehydrogenase N-terminal domain-containing protein [Hyphomonas sp.]
MAYDAPIDDMAFTLQAVAGLSKLEGLPGFETYDPDLIAPILEEAAKLARDVLAPINQSGDAAGAQLTE